MRHRNTWAVVNLQNARQNFREIRKKVGTQIKIMAIVKANAYGHGFPMVQALVSEGADILGVAFVEEALALRRQGLKDIPLFILGTTMVSEIAELVDNNLTPGVYQYEFAKALSDYLSNLKQQRSTPYAIHIKIDTGMGRLGYMPQEAVEEILKIAALPHIAIEGLYTHLATADEADKTYTQLQIQRFQKVVEDLKEKGINPPLVHIENSAGIIEFAKNLYTAVRPGIVLYGYYPSQEVHTENLPILPVLSLYTTITHLKTIAPGDSLGYGRRYIAESSRKIATLPIGYSDGLSRILSGKGYQVKIGDEFAPIVGNICMDQCMVDVTHLDKVAVGDRVEIFGEDYPADTMAQALGTIVYEVLCMVSARVPRQYIDA
ncbi:MAG: alanine racemase [Eubacteriaceae bacterium]|jgi:alanine racemase|nr:alanine racemase [Eubacteriaceae bacterium]